MSSALAPIPLLSDVQVAPRSLEAFASVLDAAGVDRVQRGIEEARPVFAGRTVWNVNSTARGGGVAEMLGPLLGYAQGIGVSARWVVVRGNPEFFAITKRLHNRLHGSVGDGGPLGTHEREVYTSTLAPIARELADRVDRGDIVLLHDPQTAGMVPALSALGVPVVWRCHIGADRADDLVRSARHFLRPDVLAADRCVFSRPAYAWESIPRDRLAFVMPSIDPFSAKNTAMEPSVTEDVLGASGITDHVPAHPTTCTIGGRDVPVVRRVDGERAGPLPAGARFVLQVSRWDRLKDPVGVIDVFAEHIARQVPDVHLVYAGPSVAGVTDDPEGAAVYEQACARRAELPEDLRRRVHLLLVPMDDPDENAVVINALQRTAAIVLQKSLAEGFGLTVTEAMWKARPVVASAVGGIVDQIDHDRCGLLVDDPSDLGAFGEAIVTLLQDPARAATLGAAARERVRHHFLSDRSLIDYLHVLTPLAAAAPLDGP